MTCLDGGLITMQHTEEMNSAHRHARRWHHSLESLFIAFFAVWSLSCLWLNTLGCLCSIVSTCLKFLETNPLQHTENWSWSLTTANQTGPKSIRSKWPDFDIYGSELLPERKQQHNQTRTVFRGPLRSMWPSSREVYLHSQSRCYSGLSVPSGPCTMGRQAAGQNSIWRWISHWPFYFKKMMRRGYRDALKNNINKCM